MTAATLLVRERPVRARSHLIAKRLQRFAWRHRQAVSEVARRHPRLADLALSFPALLFALTVPRPRFDAERVIERVIAGAPLGEIASAADLPMWSRKLSPEAFLHPIPPLPDGDLFRMQIGNWLPESTAAANRWLIAVSNAWVWGHEALALWFARHLRDGRSGYVLDNWRMLSLWAWHCTHAEAHASLYLQSRWSPEMSPRQAVDAARDWLASVMTAMRMEEVRIEDPWAEPATVDGYSFEPVLTAADLINHAVGLQNCARRYAGHIVVGRARIWVIRREGQVTGMVRLAAEYQQPYPTLAEARGVRNAALRPEELMAVHRWVRAFAPLREPTAAFRREANPAASWRKMWRDYWLAKRRIPAWLGASIDWRAWSELLDAHHTRTARRRGRRR